MRWICEHTAEATRTTAAFTSTAWAATTYAATLTVAA